MSSFSLAVRLEGDECSSCEVELLDVGSWPVGSLDEILIVEAESTTLFLSQRRSSDVHAMHVAILVPPSLLESYATVTSEPSSQQCKFMQKLRDEGIQPRVLGQIHRLLAQEEQCRIRALIYATGATQKRTSDILLLDISHCYGGWLDEMKRKLSGEPMSFYDNATIEFFPLSTITTERADSAASSMGLLYEIPTCAVCLHRIYPPRLGMPKPRNDQLCSEYCTGAAAAGGCRNENYLRPWSSPSACKACKMIAQHDDNTAITQNNRGVFSTVSSELADVFCNCCALQETLWVCLACGFVGCGRYSQGHAANHFSETKHAFSLEMATMRIWDYVSGEFAHRGDLLKCPSIRRHHPQWADVALPWEDGKTTGAIEKGASFEEASSKKATLIGEEYEALLQSALEDQAQHYEGEISRLHAALTADQIDENTVTQSETAEIEKLKIEIKRNREELDAVSRNLLDMQAQEAGHRAASQRLLREQGIAKDLLDKIREEKEKEHQRGDMQVEDLEQQIADLTANLRMRHQISQDEELSQAHIYGTVTTKQSSSKRGGKKSRRGNRK